ncbi:MAG: 30S ribosomal protein S6 [Clostridia bacterium]|nr:30S ribosomal protein S6 [Clostridia bacterium]
MKSYELLYIIDNSLSEEQKGALVEKVSSIITANGGTELNVDKWGERKYAYPINYKTEGYYCLVTFKAEVNAVKPISDLLNITENVVRHMIVTK